MSLTAQDYARQWIVHGLCQSGHHRVCKMFEEWNLKAENPCACTECDHPKPPLEKPLRVELEGARYADKQNDSTEKVGKRLDYASMLEVGLPDTTEQPVSPRDEKEADVAASKSTKASKKATKDTTDNTDRRSRGALEESVLAITDLFEDGKVDLPEGKTLTPHTIANLIQEKEGLDKPPSTGAVTAVLKRWDENYGFALTHNKPYAFKSYSAAGKKKGLDALKEKHREKLKAERAANKDANAA